MRDGLSLLDQLIAFGGGRVEEGAARAMLGTVDRQQVVRIAELLAAGEPAGLLEYARALEEWSPDHAQMLDALAALLARIALKQAVPDYESSFITRRRSWGGVTCSGRRTRAPVSR
jgi:DNA polymerase-3 subunit gamma/tau